MAQNRPYQGYPYVNPVVIDVPSLDPATAARWTNLPRKPVGIQARNQEPSDRAGTSRDTEQNLLKTNAGSAGADNCKDDANSVEDVSVVYIDVPATSASTVLETPSSTNQDREGAFVQDTILYDPFKDRRIELRGTGDDGGSDNGDMDCDRNYRTRLPPPSVSQLAATGCSSGYTASSSFGTSTNPNLPAFMSKEAGFYGRQPTPDDGFPLAPIPVTDFPEPPPAYTEFDQTNQSINQQTTAPPRTEVITTVTDPTSTIRPGSDRKLLQCQHCGQRVHSLVVKESGVFTHLIALLFAILCLIPIVILIYCTDGCKYRNHYCPNCNQLIGYEIPILCQQMAFV